MVRRSAFAGQTTECGDVSALYKWRLRTAWRPVTRSASMAEVEFVNNVRNLLVLSAQNASYSLYSTSPKSVSVAYASVRCEPSWRYQKPNALSASLAWRTTSLSKGVPALASLARIFLKFASRSQLSLSFGCLRVIARCAAAPRRRSCWRGQILITSSFCRKTRARNSFLANLNKP